MEDLVETSSETEVSGDEADDKRIVHPELQRARKLVLNQTASELLDWFNKDHGLEQANLAFRYASHEAKVLSAKLAIPSDEAFELTVKAVFLVQHQLYKKDCRVWKYKNKAARLGTAMSTESFPEPYYCDSYNSATDNSIVSNRSSSDKLTNIIDHCKSAVSNKFQNFKKDCRTWLHKTSGVKQKQTRAWSPPSVTCDDYDAVDFKRPRHALSDPILSSNKDSIHCRNTSRSSFSCESFPSAVQVQGETEGSRTYRKYSEYEPVPTSDTLVLYCVDGLARRVSRTTEKQYDVQPGAIPITDDMPRRGMYPCEAFVHHEESLPRLPSVPTRTGSSGSLTSDEEPWSPIKGSDHERTQLPCHVSEEFTCLNFQTESPVNGTDDETLRNLHGNTITPDDIDVNCGILVSTSEANLNMNH